MSRDMLKQMEIFLKEVVPETGWEPDGDNWVVIALDIAIRYAPQMKIAAQRGAPPYTDFQRVVRHAVPLAEVIDHRNRFGGTYEQARVAVGIPLGTFKKLKVNYKELWHNLQTNSQDVQDLLKFKAEQKRDT